jgi:hypothetical protein
MPPVSSTRIYYPQVVPAIVRAPVAAVYRGRGNSAISYDTLHTNLESGLPTLRTKLYWFEHSYGEIPADTMSQFQHSLTDFAPPLEITNGNMCSRRNWGVYLVGVST